MINSNVQEMAMCEFMWALINYWSSAKNWNVSRNLARFVTSEWLSFFPQQLVKQIEDIQVICSAQTSVAVYSKGEEGAAHQWVPIYWNQTSSPEKFT